MRVDRICYEQLFPTGVYANQRYRAEAEFQEGDDFSECFKILKSAVEKTFAELNPQINWDEAKQEEPDSPEEQTIKGIINSINSSKTLKTLEYVKPTGDIANNKKIMEAYNNKLKSFQ